VSEQALTAPRAASAPLDEVLRWLKGSADGLSGAEASARLLRYGPNAVRTHRVSAIAVLGRQLRSAVLGLLAATAVVSFFLGDSKQAIIIGIILAASIGLGFVNEYRAERASAALHSRVHHTTVVRRDGQPGNGHRAGWTPRRGRQQSPLPRAGVQRHERRRIGRFGSRSSDRWSAFARRSTRVPDPVGRLR